MMSREDEITIIVSTLVHKPKRTLEDIKAAAKCIGVSVSTIYRWMQKYRSQSTLNFKHHKKGNRTSRLDPDVMRLIREEVDHYPKKHASIRQCYLAIKRRVEVINSNPMRIKKFSVPSYPTVRRAFYKIRNL